MTTRACSRKEIVTTGATAFNTLVLHAVLWISKAGSIFPSRILITIIVLFISFQMRMLLASFGIFLDNMTTLVIAAVHFMSLTTIQDVSFT